MSLKKKPIQSVKIRNRKFGLVTEYLMDGKVHAAFHQTSFGLSFEDGKRAGLRERKNRSELSVDDGTIPPHSFFSAVSKTLRVVLGGQELRVELGSLRERSSVGSEIFIGDDLVGVFWIKKVLGFTTSVVLDLFCDLPDRDAVYLAQLINFAPNDALPILRGET